MIDFELSESSRTTQQMVHAVAEQMMRPIAREYDEREHEKPWDFLNTMWQVSSASPSERNLTMCLSIEELSWGDAGL
jgi:acyl-CoA dehydrogenase